MIIELVNLFCYNNNGDAYDCGRERMLLTTPFVMITVNEKLNSIKWGSCPMSKKAVDSEEMMKLKREEQIADIRKRLSELRTEDFGEIEPLPTP